VNFGIMTLPSGGFEEVVLVGVERESLLGNAWSMAEGTADSIRQTDGIIVDADEDAKLEYPRIGEVREIGGKRARIVAKSKGIVGFLAAPYVFTTIDRATEYAGKDPGYCNYYLVQTAEGVDPKLVCRAIEERIPELDAHVASDYSKISIDYWMTRTGIGISFGLATVLGLIIGVVMVGQTLYALVLDRLHEFATLKAIGAPESRVYGILLLQAMIMAVVGTLVGMVLVAVIQKFGTSPKAPIVIPLWLTIGTTLLVVAICMLSAILPYLRVRSVEPVMVLQS
jgi:putative ABC transport system permease protein